MKESERDLYRKFSSVQTKLDARSHALTTPTKGVGKGSAGGRAGEEVHNENSEGTAGALTQCGGEWARKLSQQREHTKKRPGMQLWLQTMVNQTQKPNQK